MIGRIPDSRARAIRGESPPSLSASSQAISRISSRSMDLHLLVRDHRHRLECAGRDHGTPSDTSPRWKLVFSVHLGRRVARTSCAESEGSKSMNRLKCLRRFSAPMLDRKLRSEQELLAGSSFGSWGTSLPRTARLRMVWRSWWMWAGRVVRRGRWLMKKAWCAEWLRRLRGREGGRGWRRRGGCGGFRARPGRLPGGRRGPSVRPLWRRCGVVRRGGEGER